ncbi:MAG: triose-phosphate isomerase, partial [Candidatus Aenigmatarchaeota archaeon]
MRTPCLVINFKAFKEGSGKNALKIAKLAEKISNKLNVCIVVCPNFFDLKEIAKRVSIFVFAQHMDAIEEGAYTGHVTAYHLKEAGAKGVILNHSEKRMELDDIESAIDLAKKYKLISIVCANNVDVAKAVAVLESDFIALEPPELIGGNVSVSSAQPEVITKFVKEIRKYNKKVKLLVGAGIKTKEDVKKSLE